MSRIIVLPVATSSVFSAHALTIVFICLSLPFNSPPPKATRWVRSRCGLYKLVHSRRLHVLFKRAFNLKLATLAGYCVTDLRAVERLSVSATSSNKAFLLVHVS